jgi:small-conductance mechanosensitive channel
VKTALPIIVFAVFVALIWLRNGGRGGADPVTRSGGGPLRRALLGDPPVAGPADAFVRYGFFAAWALGGVAIVSGSLDLIGLLAAAGALLVAIGVALTIDLDGVRDRLAERERRSFSHRVLGTRGAVNRLFAFCVVLIGLAWLGIGIAGLAGGLR